MNMKTKTRWDLKLILPDESDKSIASLRKKVETETNSFVEKWKNRTDYLADPKILAEALTEYERYERVFSGDATECYFYELSSMLDQTDPKVKAKLNKALDFGKKMQNEIQFFELNISKITKDAQPMFLQSSVLFPYKHFLEKLFAWGEHLLSDPEEKILNLKKTTAYDNWVKMVEEFLSREEVEVVMENGKKSKQNFSQIAGLIDSQTKKTRDSAAKQFNAVLAKYLDVAEQEINSVLADKKINDELRHFSKAEDARLLGDDVDSSAVDSLVTVVSKANHLSAKYYELKAKLFGFSKLAYHERNVPYGNLEKKYSFDDSVELVSDVFSKLSPRFSQIFQGFLENGQIDVYPAKGKHGGAACWHNLISHPTFVLLNHNDRLRDVATLAHEMGHGINNELMKEKQNALGFGSPTSTAEVASTFMEDFVFQKLLQDTDDELRLQLLMGKLGDEVSTIFRQVAFFQFERELHADFRTKGYLTSKEIGELFKKHMKSYMGDFVEQSEGSANWWVHVSHFRYYFYVYSYASGLLISKYLQSQVRKNSQFIDKVIELLSTGTALSPKDTFAKMGVNMNEEFWKQGVAQFEQLLDETWNLAYKTGKIKA